MNPSEEKYCFVNSNEYISYTHKFLEMKEILSKKKQKIETSHNKLKTFIIQKREFKKKIHNHQLKIQQMRKDLLFLKKLYKDNMIVPMKREIENLFDNILQYNTITKKQNEIKTKINSIKKILKRNNTNINALKFVLEHYKNENQLLENTYINATKYIGEELIDDSDFEFNTTNIHDDENDNDDHEELEKQNNNLNDDFILNSSFKMIDDEECEDNIDGANDNVNKNKYSNDVENYEEPNKESDENSKNKYNKEEIPIDLYYFFFILLAHYADWEKSTNSATSINHNLYLFYEILFINDKNPNKDYINNDNINKILEKIVNPIKLFWNQKINDDVNKKVKIKNPFLDSKNPYINDKKRNESSGSGSGVDKPGKFKEFLQKIFKHINENFNKNEIIDMLIKGEILCLKTYLELFKTFIHGNEEEYNQNENVIFKKYKPLNLEEDNYTIKKKLFENIIKKLEDEIEYSKLNYEKIQLFKFNPEVGGGGVTGKANEDQKKSSNNFKSYFSTNIPFMHLRLSHSILDEISSKINNDTDQTKITELMKNEISILKIHVDFENRIHVKTGSFLLPPFGSIILLLLL